MKDISHKINSLRMATAQATLNLATATIEMILAGRIPKGNPLEVAKVAAVQAAKNTSQIIPYCHPILLDAVDIDFSLKERQIVIEATVKAIHKTGVEMEALSAVSIAALTLYDMLKPVDRSMEIGGIRLLSKKGGKTDFTESFGTPPGAAVVVISDSAAAGTSTDRSGQIIIDQVTEAGMEVIEYKIIPDQLEVIVAELKALVDQHHVDIIFTTGGTGIGARDCTPEAMEQIIKTDIPGVVEAARAYGQDRTPYSMLSRAKAGLRGKTLIINLPGSPQGVSESLDAILPGILHALKLLHGEEHHHVRPEKRKPDHD